MKFKMVGIISLVLLAILTMSAVCATDNNLTGEIMGIENTQNDEIGLEQQDNENAIGDNANHDINSDKESKDVLGKSNEDDVSLENPDESSLLGLTVTSTVMRASTAEPTKLTASNSEPTKLTATKKKTKAHYVKVGKYKGKLTTKQYKKLKVFYKKNKKYGSVTIKCTNKKYHKITISYLKGVNGMNGKYYSKGFYASVWDTRHGLDGLKISNKRVKIY